MRATGVVAEPTGLGPNDHVVWFYEEPEQFRAAAQRFLLEGLDRGERLLCVGDVAVSSVADGTVALPQVRELVHAGALQMVPTAEVYRTGSASRSIDDQLAFYATALEQALAAGYTGVRVAAEVTEMARDPERWAEHLRWERLADKFISRDPMPTLCAYRGDVVHSEMVVRLNSIHPLGHGPESDVSFRLFFGGGALMLTGEVDAFCAARLEALLEETDAEEPVVLDLSGLQFADAAGVAVIARWGRSLARRGFALQLRCAPAIVGRVWSLLAFGGAAAFVDHEVAE